jgi:hypothetical protein
VIVAAALMSARWLSACGKLPTPGCRPTSYSSEDKSWPARHRCSRLTLSTRRTRRGRDAEIARHRTRKSALCPRRTEVSQGGMASLRPAAPRRLVARGWPPERVSLHVFRSICFALWVSSMSATGRRPAPGLSSASRLGLEEVGVRRFAPDPPFLDLPGKPGRASPGGELEGPQAGRRQASAGQGR